MPYLTQAEADAATAAGVVFADGVARSAQIGQIQNLIPGSLNRYKNARARVKVSAGDGLIAVCGTSISLGAYAGATGGAANNDQVRPRALNVRLAEQLSRDGLNSSSRSFYGNGYNVAAVGNTFQFYDNRLTVTGGWTPSNTIGFSAGGFAVRASAAGTIAFNFSGAADTVVIYEVQSNAFATGTYSVDIDGVSVSSSQTTVSASNSVRKITLTFAAVSAGAHVLNINWVSGTVAIMGAKLSLSTQPEYAILNLAAGASNSAQWASVANGTASPSYIVATGLNPDLVIFEAGPNDWLPAQTAYTNAGGGSAGDAAVAPLLASYAANVQAFLSYAKANGSAFSDVIFNTSFPSSESGGVGFFCSIAIQQQFVDAGIAVCKTLGVPYFDTWRALGTWASMNIAGLPSATQDGVHGNRVGAFNYQQIICKGLAAI